jgi:hypothetical protein
MNVCSCLFVVCCPAYVEAFATGRSLFQRNPTEHLNRLKKPPVCEAAKVPLSRTVEARGRRAGPSANVYVCRHGMIIER